MVANERATLYGLLLVYNGRRVHYGPAVTSQHARELFIRQALVPARSIPGQPFVAHNLKLIAGVEGSWSTKRAGPTSWSTTS